jgi:predicted nucleic acid-binding protein
MIVLDTNVLSEMMRPTPAPAVREWFNQQPIVALYANAITSAEILRGIEIIADGKRKNALKLAFHELMGLFVTATLPFDDAAAARYGAIAASARRAGKGFPTLDGFIAAIAHSRGFMVATRDAAAYLAGGVKVVNPWVDMEKSGPD